MIICMLVVRVAPGVSSICCRVMSVVGVTVSVVRLVGADPLTTMVCVAPSSDIGMWSTGFVPELTISCSLTGAKPAAAIFRWYTPMGVWAISNSPSAFGRGGQLKTNWRLGSMKRDVSSLNGTVLRIVDDATHRGEDCGHRGKRRREQKENGNKWR